MKKLLRLSFYFFAATAILLSSCKKDDDEEPEVNPVEVLTQHLEDTGMDLDHVIKNADGMKFVMGAPADGDVSGKYVIDIRKDVDFANGYIEGAHNVALSSILDEAAKADKPILVVCYTGQTACYATSLLRLYGYHDAQALKWGMSGWNAEFAGSWNNNVGNGADGHSNWTDAAAPTNLTYDLPEWTSTSTDGEAILKERVEAVLAAGFKGVGPGDVLDNPGDYFINNYYSEAHYTGFGHIDGAYRIQPLLLTDGSIENLDPTKTVVTYCYTGQTSAVITAFLNVLGYDAMSLKFGMNGLWNENPFWDNEDITNQWGFDSNPKDLPYVN
jgi:rhodanese-related sulfurtransferase